MFCGAGEAKGTLLRARLVPRSVLRASRAAFMDLVATGTNRRKRSLTLLGRGPGQ
jgi:hypothetical protein